MPLASASSTGPAQALERLTQDLFDATTRLHPSWATDLGLHEFDHQVAEPSRAAVLEEVRMQEGWLQRAEGIARDGAQLTLDQRVDLEALRYALHLGLFQAQEARQWERNPDLAMEFLDHVFGLLMKDVVPVEQRCAAIAARLDKAPAFLEQGRDRFQGPCPALWVAMALESVEGAPALLEAAEQLAQQEGVNSATREAVRAAAKRARGAFDEHRDWLRTLEGKAQADGWALGGARFDTLVGLRALGADADAILARGEALVVELRSTTQRAAEALLREVGEQPGSAPVQQAQEVLARDHPKDWPSVLQAYRDEIARARGFVEEQGIATLPSGERLDVVETPAYLRHVLPFAAYVSPGRFEPRQVGIYLVTPREPKEFPMADVRNTTVHEGYPGHHLQLTGANRHPSLARLFVRATESIEGWAHYCEEMMLDAGYGAGEQGATSPAALRFVVAKDQLWRACRIVLDVGLHRGSTSFDGAVTMLRDVARMGEPQARAEVKRYTQSPAYQLSYLWGKLAIQTMARDAKTHGMGTKDFHDRYIGAGSLPLGLMRRALGL